MLRLLLSSLMMPKMYRSTRIKRGSIKYRGSPRRAARQLVSVRNWKYSIISYNPPCNVKKTLLNQSQISQKSDNISSLFVFADIIGHD